MTSLNGPTDMYLHNVLYYDKDKHKHIPVILLLLYTYNVHVHVCTKVFSINYCMYIHVHTQYIYICETLREHIL